MLQRDSQRPVRDVVVQPVLASGLGGRTRREDDEIEIIDLDSPLPDQIKPTTWHQG